MTPRSPRDARYRGPGSPVRFPSERSSAVLLPETSAQLNGLTSSILISASSLGLDHMERPTSALQSAGYAARGPLNAEPHTKEVGRDAVYNHHCLRSACGDDSRRGPVTGSAHAGTAFADVG